VKHLARTLAFAALFALLGLGASHVTIRIPAQAVGVRSSKWGGGFEERDFAAGMHLAVPGLHDWYLLDGTSQRIDFGGPPEGAEGATGAEARPALEIRTLDNNQVKIEATVTFRIRAGEAHELVRDGLELDYRRRAATTAEDVLRAELRHLSSEDWFDTERRLAEVARLAPLIDAELAALHLELGRVILHTSGFPASFEEKLQEKQIYYQKAELSKAKRAVEDAQADAGLFSAETESLEKQRLAEWNKTLQEARSAAERALAEVLPRAKAYERETRAQADLEHDRLIAEGRLAHERAQAEAERLRYEALAGEAGRLYIARLAAQNLAIESVEMDASDPRVPLLFDLDEVTKTLIGGTQ
jgi:regulator of protease activity HflC (stomatin/prohibitin superfamily)